MEMADRIKSRRLALGYTQEELAEKVGLQKSAIAKYENGRVENMKRSMIEKMSQVLECSPAYLMGWAGA
ncbi:helix-turn-helix domain-containing protein, partial [Pseudomonas aeruginosa]